MAKATCSINRCTKPAVARGWCNSHWKRWRRWGHPLGSAPENTCGVDGCQRRYLAQGYCGMHYARWKKHGDPLYVRPSAYPDGKHRQHGYVKVRAPKGHPGAQANGYILEHRLVAESIVGRHLTPEEVVHHINGIRDDNRPENLEVMLASEHNKRRKLDTCPHCNRPLRQRINP